MLSSSITSSALVSKVGGIIWPSAFRLMTSAILVGGFGTLQNTINLSSGTDEGVDGVHAIGEETTNGKRHCTDAYRERC